MSRAFESLLATGSGLCAKGVSSVIPRERLTPKQQWTRDFGYPAHSGASTSILMILFWTSAGTAATRLPTSAAMYDCFVHVFEPVPTFADVIAERFGNDDKVRLHRFAVGSTNGTLDLHLSGDGSGAFVPGPVIAVPVRAAREWRASCPRDRGCQLNIEGGEYDLIPALDGSSFLPRIKRLFIQFHSISETSTQDRRRCQEILSRTHTCDWDYPFVWESWSRKP